MTDIALDFAGNALDISIENGDFKIENGFDTAILVSLLTDARAPESKVIRPEDRRGWLGNIESQVDGRDLGGLLWLSDQRRLNQDTLNEVVDYARKALAWFVEDTIALRVTVTGEIVPISGIALSIDIVSLEGITSNYYIKLWELTGGNKFSRF